GDNAGAFNWYLMSARAVDGYFNKELPRMSLATQQAELKNRSQKQLSQLLSVTSNGAQLDHAYGLIFNWKGALIKELAQQNKVARTAASPETQDKLKELHEIRSQLAGWYQQLGTINFQKWKEKNREL